MMIAKIMFLCYCIIEIKVIMIMENEMIMKMKILVAVEKIMFFCCMIEVTVTMKEITSVITIVILE